MASQGPSLPAPSVVAGGAFPKRESSLRLATSRLVALICAGFGVMVLGACAPHDSPLNAKIGEVPALATQADWRLITVRDNPNKPGGKVVCSEPSPDIAMALSTALTLSANASLPQGPSGGVSFNRATTAQALALAGRTAAVLALRDGLFRACEAYANGIIGDNAYALILSQYGLLLDNLILGEAAGGASANVSGSSGSTKEGADSAPPAKNSATKAASAKKAAANAGPPAATPAEAVSRIATAYMQNLPAEGLEALLVSCLTLYDPTRPRGPSEKQAEVLLDQNRCNSVIDRVIELALRRPVPPSSHGR